MVASRDLDPGEVIFIEEALVTGPGRNHYPVCLGDYQYPDGTSYCSKCGWQVCSELCETKAPHLKECEIFASQKVNCMIDDLDNTTFLMDFIGPLRLAVAVQDSADPIVRLVWVAS